MTTIGDNIIIIKYNKALPNDFIILSEPFSLESSYISYQNFKNKHIRIPNKILPIIDKILFIINIKYKKTPSAGFEPATYRLTAERSAN